MPASYSGLRLEIDASVAIVTLDRPEALNALDLALAQSLRDVMIDLDGDADIRAIVLTGAGRAFSAGADLKYRQSVGVPERNEHIRAINRAMAQIEATGKPVLAAVNGFALGGGTELAAACDLRYAAYEAAFGLPEITLGAFPGAGGPVRLPRLIGRGKAKEMIFTGQRIDGQEAERIGLVQKVFPLADLLPETLKIAHVIAANGPLGLRGAKQLINQGMEMAIGGALALSDALRFPLDATEDYNEGLAAFREKRKPVFRGR